MVPQQRWKTWSPIGWWWDVLSELHLTVRLQAQQPMRLEILTICAGVERMSRSSNDVAHEISNSADLFEQFVDGA